MEATTGGRERDIKGEGRERNGIDAGKPSKWGIDFSVTYFWGIFAFNDYSHKNCRNCNYTLWSSNFSGFKKPSLVIMPLFVFFFAIIDKRVRTFCCRAFIMITLICPFPPSFNHNPIPSTSIQGETFTFIPLVFNMCTAVIIIISRDLSSGGSV